MKISRLPMDLRIASLYALFGGAWILFSDSLLAAFVEDPAIITRIQTYKGWGFVAASALFICLLLRRELQVRAAAEEELAESRKRYHAAFDDLLEGVQIIDPKWRYVYLNEAAARHGRAARPALTGRTMMEMYPGIETTEVFAVLRDCMANRIARQAENEFIYPDGAKGWFNLSIQPAPEGILILSVDITARKQADEAVRKNEEQYRRLLEYSPYGIVVHQQGRLVYLNPAAIGAINAASAGELLGKPVMDFVHPDSRPAVAKRLQEMSAGKDAPPLEEKFIRLDGQVIDVEVTAYSFVYQDQPAVQVVFRDVTESRRVMEALRQAEENYRGIFENAVEGIFQSTPQGRFLAVNPAFARMLAYETPEELVSTVTDIGSQLYVDALRRAEFTRLMTERDVLTDFEFEMLRKDGGRIWVKENVRAVRDEAGTILFFEGTAEDITGRKIAEEEIRRRAEEFAALYDTARDLAAYHELSGLLQAIVERARALLGASASGIYLYDPERGDLEMSLTVGLSVPIGARLQMGEGMAGKVAQTRQPLIVDNYSTWEGRSPQYEGYPIKAVIQVPMLYEGQLTGVLAVDGDPASERKFSQNDLRILALLAEYAASAIRSTRLYEQAHKEIAERKQAEEALREAERLYRTLVEQLPNVVTYIDSVDPQVGTLYVSPQIEEMLGYKPEEWRADPRIWHRCIYPEDRDHILAEDRRHDETGDTLTCEYRIMAKDDRVVWVYDEAVMLRDESGKPLYSHGIMIDITERKLGEMALHESEKKYRALFEQSHDAMFILDLQGNYLIANQRAADMLGYAPNELVGLSVRDTSAEPAQSRDVLKRVLGGEQIPLYERIFRRKNGELIPVEINLELIRDLYGKPLHIQSAVRDISERKRAEAALAASEGRFRALFEDVPIPIWEEDFSEVKKILDSLKAAGVSDFRAYFAEHPEVAAECSQKIRVLDVNRAALKLFKAQSKAELIETTSSEISSGEAEHNLEDFIAIAEGRPGNSWEGLDTTLNGEIIQISLAWSAVPGFEGDYARVILTTTDITERKLAEDALRASEETFHGLFNSVAEAIYIQDVNGRFLDINEGVLQMYGHPKEFFIGNTPEPLGAPGRNNLPEVAKAVEAAFNGEPQQFEFWGIRSNGEVFPKEVRLYKGAYFGQDVVIALAQDITERKQAEETLSQQLGELELLYQSGLALSSELEPKQVAEKLIEALETKMDWHHIAIRKYDPERDRLEVLSFKQPNLDNKTQMQAVEERFNEAVTNSSTGLSGWVVRHGQTVRSGNVKADERYTETYPDIQSGLYAPMTLGERVVGVISVESEGLNAFTESDERLLKTVANQAAVAFENARLFQGLQHELVERIQAETARLQSEERYRQTLDTMMEGCQIIGFDWQYLYINEKAAQQGRFSREALLGHIMPEMYPGIEATNMFGVLRECMESRLACRMENEFHYGDGTTGWFDLSIQPVPEGIFILSVDITERKQAEQALRASEERMRLTLQTTSDGFWIVNQEGNFLEVNNAYCEMSGYSRSELLKMRIPDVEALESLEGTQSHIARIESERHERFETRHRRKDGSAFDVEFTVNLLDEDTGLFICFCRDITERKRAEQALRESEARLGDAARIAHFGYWDRDFSAKTITLSEEACRIFGISAQYRFFNLPEWHEQWLQLIHPEDRSRVEEILKDALAGGLPYNADYRVIRPDGDIRHVHSFADLTRDKSGKPIRLFGTMIDITERKLAEREVLNRTQDLTLINALNEAANRGESIETITNVFSQEAYSIFDCRDAAVYLLSLDGKYLEMQNNSISHELTKRIEEFIGVSIPRVRLPVNEGGHTKYLLSRTEGVVTDDPMEIQKWMFEFTESTFLPNVLREPIRAIIPRVFDLLGIRSIITIPLVSSGQIIGLMDFSSAGQLTNEDLARLIPISRQMTAILLRKQAESVVETQLRRITALNDIDRAIGSSLDMRLSLEVLLKEVVTQLGVDAADILLMNPVDLALEYFAGRGFRTSAIRQTRMMAGQGFTGKSVLEKKVVHVPNLRDAESEVVRKSLLKGEDFVEYFGVPLVAKGTLKGVLEIFNRALLVPDPDWLTYLETLGGQAAIAIDNAQLFEGLQTSNQELMAAYDATITGWSHAMDLRDEETEGHTQRVTELTRILAIRMGVSEQDQIHMRRGALLHDIGKLGVPDHILLKPGPLTSEEWEVMHKHPTYAFKMLLPITYLQPALDIPYCHHEKWDGSGYPRGLKGEEIPLVARIFAVVDVWDAITTDRPYRNAWSKEAAIQHIRAESGRHFDPKVVENFLGLMAHEH